MTYLRKTRDVFTIQQNFGYGHGWEDVSAASTMRDALREKREYRENQPEYPIRIRITRERIQEDERV